MVFKNILNFPFNIFVQLLQNLKILPNTSANKLLNLNQDHPSKKQSLIVKVNSKTSLKKIYFRSNGFKIEDGCYENFSHSNVLS